MREKKYFNDFIYYHAPNVALFLSFVYNMASAAINVKKRPIFKCNIAILFWHFYRKFGLAGLFKGLEAKLLQTVLTAALMFLLYEKIASCTFRVMGLNKNVYEKH